MRGDLHSFGWRLFCSALLHAAGLTASVLFTSGLFFSAPARVFVNPGFMAAGSARQTEFIILPETAQEELIPSHRLKESGSSPSADVPETGFAQGALVDSRSGWGNAPPVYPTLARKNGWEGDVLLRVRVSGRGAAQGIEVLQSSGYPMLDDAAMTAVARWRFLPAMRRRKPVDSLVEIPVRFRLRDRSSQ